MEKTSRTPTPRAERAPTGVTTRIARTRIRSLLSLSLALALTAAAHAAFLSPRLTRLLQRLSGIRSRHDYAYEHAAASIRLCCHAGIRPRHDHDHAGIRSHYEHAHDPSATIRSC